MRARKSWSDTTGEGPRARGTLSSSERMAAQRGKDHRGGLGGHRLQSPGWVRKIARRYNERGVEGLGDRRHQNPGAKERALLDEAGEAELVEALQGPPPARVGGGVWSGPKGARGIAH